MSTAVTAPEEVQLPKAVLKRMMKKQLAQSDNAAIRDANISADAMLAVSEAAKVFISYLTCTANDICAEHKRSTISADDVLSALEELEFGEFCDVLRSDLESVWFNDACLGLHRTCVSTNRVPHRGQGKGISGQSEKGGQHRDGRCRRCSRWRDDGAVALFRRMWVALFCCRTRGAHRRLLPTQWGCSQ